MKVAYLVSLPTIPKVDSSSIHVALSDYFSWTGYVDSFDLPRRRGDEIVQVGVSEIDFTANLYIGKSVHEAKILHDKYHGSAKIGCVVAGYDDYMVVSHLPFVDVVAVYPQSSDGISRLRMFDLVISSGDIVRKDHWLLGVPNPAELSMYSRFSGYVQGLISAAICESAFVYSMYGVRLSSHRGVFEIMDVFNSSDFNFSKWLSYKPDKEQLRTLLYNIDLIDRFSTGSEVADKYAQKLYAILEGVS
jgi:hypothetical protein